MKTHKCAAWSVVDVTMLRHVFNYMFMRIKSGRHTWIVRCRFSDNIHCTFRLMHFCEFFFIRVIRFLSLTKIAVFNRISRWITVTGPGLFMFNVFDFFFSIKRIMKVLKNIFNRAIDVSKRDQHYLIEFCMIRSRVTQRDRVAPFN